MNDTARLLGRLLSPDNVQRRAAEVDLEVMVDRQGFFPSVVAVLSSCEASLLECQAGAAVLKNLSHRLAKSDVPLVLFGLLDLMCHSAFFSNRQLAALVASATARVAKAYVDLHGHDVLREVVLPRAADLLNSTEELHVQRGVSLLVELLVELGGNACTAELFVGLIPLVSKLCCSLESKLPAAVKCRLWELLVEIVESCAERSDEVLAFLLQETPRYCRIAFREFDETNAEENKSVVSSLRLLMTLVSWRTASFLCYPDFFQGLMQSIEVNDDAVRRMECCCATDDLVATEAVRATALRWELLAVVLKKKQVRKHVVHLFGGMLTPMCHLVVGSCILSDAAAQQLQSDADVFLRSEAERHHDVSWLPRDVAAKCCVLLLDRFGTAWSSTLLSVLGERITMRYEILTTESWKEREAVLFIVQHVLESTTLQRLRALDATSLLSLSEVLLAVDLAEGAPPLLMARAMTVLSSILCLLRGKRSHSVPKTSPRSIERSALPMRDTEDPIMDSTLSDRLVAPVIATIECSLRLGELSVVTGVAASLLRSCLRSCRSETVVSGEMAERALNCLLQACATCSREESLHCFLDALVVWLRRYRRVGGSVPTNSFPLGYLPSLLRAPEFVLECWIRHVRDLRVAEFMVEIFSALLHCPCCDASFAERVIPWMGEIFAGMEKVEVLCLIPSVLKLVKAVMDVGSAELCNATAASLLQPLCQLLLNNDDTSVTAAAVDCLSSLLKRAGDAAVDITVNVTSSLLSSSSRAHLPPPAWPLPIPDATEQVVTDPRLRMSPIQQLDEAPEPIPLTDVLVALALKMLTVGRSDASLLTIGDFLEAVARRANMFSVDHMNRFLGALACRLVQHPPSLQSAMVELVHPHMIMLQQRYRDAYLSAITSHVTGGVAAVFEKILVVCVTHARGEVDNRRLCCACTALMSLLQDWPPHLSDVPVIWREPDKHLGHVGTKHEVRVVHSRGLPLPLSSCIFLCLAKILCEILQRDGAFDDVDESSESSESGSECSENSDSSEDVAEPVGEHRTESTSDDSTETAAAATDAADALPQRYRFMSGLRALAPTFFASTRAGFGESECATLFNWWC